LLVAGGTGGAWAEAPDGTGRGLQSFTAGGYASTYKGKQTISYSGAHRPGTIIISTRGRTLDFVLPGGKAIRYGIGVGREGFQWGGSTRVARKAEWPGWTPP